MIFLCCLVLIIMLHELGHLIAAKMYGCGVKTYSIGFGKPLFKFTWKGTVYQIAPVLLGGYCDLQNETSYSRSKKAFTNKTYGQKVIISLAGIWMNCVTGFISLGLFYLTYNSIFFQFYFYSLVVGLSNLLPIPCLDGSFWIVYLFEPKKNRKRFYKKVSSLFSKWFFWLMVLNILSIPYLVYLIWTGQIL